MLHSSRWPVSKVWDEIIYPFLNFNGWLLIHAGIMVKHVSKRGPCCFAHLFLLISLLSVVIHSIVLHHNNALALFPTIRKNPKVFWSALCDHIRGSIMCANFISIRNLGYHQNFKQIHWFYILQMRAVWVRMQKNVCLLYILYEYELHVDIPYLYNIVLIYLGFKKKIANAIFMRIYWNQYCTIVWKSRKSATPPIFNNLIW